MKPRLATAVLAAALVLTACSDGGDDTVAAPQETSCPGAPTPVEPPADATTDLKTKPVITTPKEPAPTALQVSDIVVGDGDLACSGQAVSMQYVGVTYADGKQFDASWDRGGEPFPFQLGGGQVIGGWDQGIVGMKVGGRRQLVIPPDLGYGPAGSPPDIPPAATLVFVVDLVSVDS
ncbi:MAG: peptidyl-prolyl cis-trans isomerase [Frankiales bacterium]|nr:peptidyl-prolyl cis-trans isomerase [Frankiales bacterium]